MTDKHPITPPLELLKQWEDEWFEEREHVDVLLIQAYQAGADQELEACCADLQTIDGWNRAVWLRSMRRPKPPSLKEQALAELAKIDVLWDTDEFGDETNAALDTIRRALEQLND